VCCARSLILWAHSLVLSAGVMLGKVDSFVFFARAPLNAEVALNNTITYPVIAHSCLMVLLAIPLAVALCVTMAVAGWVSRFFCMMVDKEGSIFGFRSGRGNLT
jgi:hypothetical protein